MGVVLCRRDRIQRDKEILTRSLIEHKSFGARLFLLQAATNRDDATGGRGFLSHSKTRTSVNCYISLLCPNAPSIFLIP
jgi:hypothetical protein